MTEGESKEWREGEGGRGMEPGVEYTHFGKGKVKVERVGKGKWKRTKERQKRREKRTGCVREKARNGGEERQ